MRGVEGRRSSVEAVSLLLPKPCSGHPLGFPLKKVDLVQELLVRSVGVTATTSFNIFDGPKKFKGLL